VLAAVLSFGASFDSFANTMGTTKNSVRARSTASTQSEAVGSFESGTKIEILAKTKGEGDFTWYKVNVSGGTGWIRGDMLDTDGNVPEVAANSATADQGTTDASVEITEGGGQDAPAASETTPEPMDPQNATVATGRVNVRSGAGTSFAQVANVAQGDSMIVTGKATDGDGKEWFYVTLADGKTGYIRSDMVSVTGPAENTDASAASSDAAPEEQPADSQQGDASADGQQGGGLTASTSSDKYFVYKDSEDVYQLVDNSGEKAVQYTVEGVLQANEYVQTHSDGTGGLFNPLTIVLLAMVIILAVLTVIFYLRLREMLYYDGGDGYDEDPDQGDGYQDEAARKGGLLSRFGRKNDNYDDYPEDDEAYPEDEDPYPDQPEPQARPQRSSARADQNPDEASGIDHARSERSGGRRARNFAQDDDDFEFEFLDLDKDEDKR
jgi:uncharacterized protein YgiM (DUF1202 family)